MPIVTVEVVADLDRTLKLDLAQSLANAIGRALDSSPGQTWVRLHLLGRDSYAENGCVVEADALPVFVTVLKRQVPLGTELQAEIASLTQAIAQVVGRPVASVHVEYAAAAADRLAFGGKLVQ
jgi:phenylpyruvate tautomerase PptA (4-oxalocrotonate tautomerase family)